MRPLTLDDLLPLDEYATRRVEFADNHRQYCERYRRVHIGPRATLTFQNRQTLWFRVQEMLRVMCLSDPDLVRRELDVCNRLLPRRDHLLAGLSSPDPGSLSLRLGDSFVPAQLVPCTPEDRALGVATWIGFTLAGADRSRFIDPEVPASIELQGFSALLPEDVRQSLNDDLTMSAREAA